MILLWIFLLPLLGGAVAWFAGHRFPALSQWAGPASLLLALVQLIVLWGRAAAVFETGEFRFDTRGVA